MTFPVSLASGCARKSVLSQFPSLKIGTEGCYRKGNWHKNTLAALLGLLALICVAAAGLLVVIQ